MNNICFVVSIRQSVCQSGIPRVNEKTFSNLPNNSIITLSSGYTLTLTSLANNSVRLTFINEAFNLNFFFDVECCSVNLFDIPIQSGSLRLAIRIACVCCNEC